MSLARRMARRNAKKKPRQPIAQNAALGPSTIQLQNPVSDHFPQFIIGNGFHWQIDALAHIERTAPPHIFEDIATEFKKYKPGFAFSQCIKYQAGLDTFCDDGQRFVVREREATGQHVIICGAGPSLAEEALFWCSPRRFSKQWWARFRYPVRWFKHWRKHGTVKADAVWGCNSALTWLRDHGFAVTHGVTVDQTPQMVNEWASAPDVEYLVASTIHPHLAQLLRDSGRRYRWFHNFVGIRRGPVKWTNEDGKPCRAPYEEWLYLTTFPGTVMCGSGLNTVTRAVDLARYMGFSKITILGADCSLRISKQPPPDAPFGSPEHKRWLEECTVMHADGGSAISGEQSPLTLGAVIDAGTPDDRVRPGHGRHWETKVDLIVSAIWLTRMAQKFPDMIQLVGDTLPNALMLKNDEFLLRLPNFRGDDGESSLPEIV